VTRAQLVFDLAAPPALGPEDFFVSPANALAVRMLSDPAGWPEGKLLLIGPAGAGKTHLLRIWAGERESAILGPAALAAELPARLPPAVAIDDADRIAGDNAAEEALFHLHNRIRAARGHLLLTARAPASRWGLRLPDLASRMEAAATATLAPPDDALLAALLVKLFADRQLAVAPNVIEWLVPRMDRSFDAAHRLVAAIDARSLALGRPVTRALAAEVMGEALDTGRAGGR
jgi:chromosomal replication initiation ATPase DnaA